MTNTKHFYENIDRFREIPIVSILGLPETGRRITARCPIHLGTGKTPSFNIYPDNSYYCFGCGAHGSNAIDLCREMGYSFAESLEELKNYL